MIWNTELAQATNQKTGSHFARRILWQRGVVVSVLSPDQSSQSQWTTASYRVTIIMLSTAENSCTAPKSAVRTARQWAGSVYPNLSFVTPNHRGSDFLLYINRPPPSLSLSHVFLALGSIPSPQISHADIFFFFAWSFAEVIKTSSPVFFLINFIACFFGNFWISWFTNMLLLRVWLLRKRKIESWTIEN